MFFSINIFYFILSQYFISMKKRRYSFQKLLKALLNVQIWICTFEFMVFLHDKLACQDRCLLHIKFSAETPIQHCFPGFLCVRSCYWSHSSRSFLIRFLCLYLCHYPPHPTSVFAVPAHILALASTELYLLMSFILHT